MACTEIIFLFLFTLSFGIVIGDYFTINWTEANPAGIGYETHYQDPSVTPLAPCPCDLHVQHCDVSCCCDKDCKTYDKSSFSCLEGLEGGEATPQDYDYNCKYQGPYSPEWYSVLCYVRVNNPYLGLFFKNEPCIQAFQQYLLRVSSPKYSYQQSLHPNDGTTFQFGYFSNANIKTTYSEDVFARQDLTLPQPLIYGVCVDDVPVTYLKDFKHQCVVSLSQKSCEKETRLKATSYLKDENLGNVLSVIGDLQTLKTVNSSVRYLCLKNSFKFLKFNGLTRITKQFIKDRWSIMEEYFEECSMEIPIYNNKTLMCENIVLSVSYYIGWKGPEIKEVRAEIVLGDVPVSLDGLYLNYLQDIEDQLFFNKRILGVKKTVSHLKPVVSLYQDFETNFYYSESLQIGNDTVLNITSNETIDSENNTEFQNISERSGNPGYEIGKPLIAGYVVNSISVEENDTSEMFSHVDVNDSTGLLIWRPDATSNCVRADTEDVVFGVNMFSACIYFLKNHSCSDVQEEVSSLMSQLIQAEVVSKIGAPNITGEDYFLPIITDNGDIPSGEGCYVPSSIQHKIIYRDVARPRNPSRRIWQIIGISTRIDHSELRFDPRQNMSITLSSSVVYYDSPWPSQISRFWEAMEDRWCAGGTCWNELFYPWTHGVDAMFGTYNRYVIDLMRNSTLLLLTCLPILYFIIGNKFQFRI